MNIANHLGDASRELLLNGHVGQRCGVEEVLSLLGFALVFEGVKVVQRLVAVLDCNPRVGSRRDDVRDILAAFLVHDRLGRRSLRSGARRDACDPHRHVGQALVGTDYPPRGFVSRTLLCRVRPRPSRCSKHCADSTLTPTSR